MLDNGAFSVHTRGHKFDPTGFYKWVEPHLGHPHWAVVPDVIGGTVEEQRELLKQWPFRKEFGLPVFHLQLPLDWLFELVDTWPRICFGSSGEFWKIGSDSWCRRMDVLFNALTKRGHIPWVHGMRMLGLAGSEYPLASADSTNVAQNHHLKGCAECMADRIDGVNNPVKWKIREEQGNLL